MVVPHEVRNALPTINRTHASNVSESARPSQPPESQGNQIKHGPATLYVIVQSEPLNFGFWGHRSFDW
uniref:Uncharacterized protein n=1 Tax=Cucumis melo TaxID=3656 RepID=A0A9I9D0W4_CUCME